MRRILACLGLVLLSCGEDGRPPGLSRLRADGESCRSSVDCRGGVCLLDSQGWRDGYCTTTGCQSESCSEGAVCVDAGAQRLCLRACEGLDDCRSGYGCVLASGQRVCAGDSSAGPGPGQAGAACESLADCRQEYECDESFPGGYCLISDCAECDMHTTCVQDRCLARCASTPDCRPGYVCEDGACQAFERAAPSVSFEQTVAALGIRCDAEQVGEDEWEVGFEVEPEWAAYTVTGFVAQGRLRPVRLEPAGLDLLETYIHHNMPATQTATSWVGRYLEISQIWPFMVPYSPRFMSAVVAGEHRLRVSSVQAPCVYVLPATAGHRLSLTIHVWLAEMTAQEAAVDADVQQVLARVGEVFGQAGIILDDVRFVQGDREQVERYQIVRDLADVRTLVAEGEPRSPDLAGHLFVDVFWVEDILDGGVSGRYLGLSGGVPGAPGLHGHPDNGLVFRMADLGVDNSAVALIMAHELGHYLGLRHTTELDVSGELGRVIGAEDPLDDTAVCPRIMQQGFGCPDADNLMFPALPQSTHLPELTVQQGQVLGWNPLVR